MMRFEDEFDGLFFTESVFSSPIVQGRCHPKQAGKLGALGDFHADLPDGVPNGEQSP
jgi:hypothetical protein